MQCVRIFFYLRHCEMEFKKALSLQEALMFYFQPR